MYFIEKNKENGHCAPMSSRHWETLYLEVLRKHEPGLSWRYHRLYTDHIEDLDRQPAMPWNDRDWHCCSSMEPAVCRYLAFDNNSKIYKIFGSEFEAAQYCVRSIVGVKYVEFNTIGELVDELIAEEMKDKDAHTLRHAVATLLGGE